MRDLSDWGLQDLTFQERSALMKRIRYSHSGTLESTTEKCYCMSPANIQFHQLELRFLSSFLKCTLQKTRMKSRATFFCLTNLTKGSWVRLSAGCRPPSVTKGKWLPVEMTEHCTALIKGLRKDNQLSAEIKLSASSSNCYFLNFKQHYFQRGFRQLLDMIAYFKWEGILQLLSKLFQISISDLFL